MRRILTALVTAATAAATLLAVAGPASANDKYGDSLAYGTATMSYTSSGYYVTVGKLRLYAGAADEPCSYRNIYGQTVRTDVAGCARVRVLDGRHNTAVLYWARSRQLGAINVH